MWCPIKSTTWRTTWLICGVLRGVLRGVQRGVQRGVHTGSGYFVARSAVVSVPAAVLSHRSPVTVDPLTTGHFQPVVERSIGASRPGIW